MIQTYSIPLVITEIGKEVYPVYMDNDYRKNVRDHYQDARSYMYCGCREDVKLYYRISEDLKVYPEKNGYEHAPFCSRYKAEDEKKTRTTAYVLNEKDGEVTAYLAFNPKNMTSDEITDTSGSVPEEAETEEIEDEELIVEGEALERPKETTEPKLQFKDLVRSINLDTYNDLVLNNKKIENKNTFSKSVYFRTKKIRPSRSQKSIGDLTIEEDGVRFIYTQLASITSTEEKGMQRLYVNTIGADGRVFKNLVFDKQLQKAGKEYVKMYGVDPDETTMVAAFQYLKKARGSSRTYRVLGRLHFFQVSDNGLYCRNEIEKDAFDKLAMIEKENPDIKMWVPADDSSIGGIINVKGKKKKILLIFKTNKNQVLKINTALFEPIVIGTEDLFYKSRLDWAIENLG